MSLLYISSVRTCHPRISRYLIIVISLFRHSVLFSSVVVSVLRLESSSMLTRLLSPTSLSLSSFVSVRRTVHVTVVSCHTRFLRLSIMSNCPFLITINYTVPFLVPLSLSVPLFVRVRITVNRFSVVLSFPVSVLYVDALQRRRSPSRLSRYRCQSLRLVSHS